MSHIFISYSRRDLDFASKIVQALADNKQDTWIDWKSIPKGEDWWEHIQNGIEEADAFLFLVSPDSAKSKICNDEIDYAERNGKRILPILIKDVDPKDVHSEISKRNWIFCRDGRDDSHKAIEETLTAIDTDYEWLKYHTKLQLKALDWERNGREISFLLNGKELQDVASTFVTGSGKDPQPTDVQRQYLLTSQENEERLRKNETRRRRQITIGLSLGLVITAVLAAIAWGQRNEANSQRSTAEAASTQAIAQQSIAQTKEAEAIQQAKIAYSRELAAIALNQLTVDQERSLLIALAANEQAHTLESNDALRRALQAFQVSSVLERCPAQAESAEDQILKLSYVFSDDGSKLAIFCDLPPRQIRILEMSSGKIISVIPVADTVLHVFNFSFSADGSTFGYIERGFGGGVLAGATIVWKLEKGQEVFSTPDMIYSTNVFLSEDGSKAWVYTPDIVGEGTFAHVYDTASGAQVAQLPILNMSSPLDGNQIALVTNNSLAIYDMNQLTKKEFPLRPDQVVEGIGVKNDAWIRQGEDVSIFDFSTGQVTDSINIGPIPNSGRNFLIGASPDGSRLAIVLDNRIEIRNFDNPQSVQILTGHEGPIGHVEFSEDSRLLISTSLDTTCRIWDVESGRLISTINKVLYARISPDKKRLVLHTEDGNLILWDLRNRGEVDSVNAGLPLTQAWFSDDGQKIFISTIAGNSLAWDWQQPGADLAPAPSNLPVAPVKMTGASPDGRFTAELNEINMLRLLNNETHSTLFETRVSTDKVNDLQFSPNSTKLILAFGSPFVTNVEGDLGWLPFRTPGELDQTAGLWDLQSMEKSAILRGSTDSVNSAMFSPDSKYIVTTSNDGYVRVYLSDIGDLEVFARQHIIRVPPELNCEEKVEFLKEKKVCPAATPTP